MTRFLLLLTIVVSLMMAVGCKNFKISVGPPKWTFSSRQSVSPLRIKPPASFTRDQIPGNTSSAFRFDAKAGQYLRMQVEQPEGSGLHEPSIVARVVGQEAQLKSLNEDFCGEAIFPLPDSTQYQIDYAPQGQKRSVSFSILEKDDPLINAGIRPEEISMTLGAFGPAKKIAIDPYEYVCGVGESWPANVVVESEKVEVRVMRSDGVTSLFPQSKEMQLLHDSLIPGAKFVEAKSLPYAGSGDAATVMSARPELITGKGWRAWRWIEGQSQDGDFPGDYLFYTVEGLTNDGRSFFRMRAEIAHPELKRLNPTNSVPENDTQLRLQLEKALAAAKPDSFTPDLNQLDTILRSLKFLR